MTRWLIAISLCWATLAAAETKRVAIVVGANAGTADQTALHYAESDAGKLARTLAELGDVAPENLFLLQGKRLADISDAFARAKRRIGEFQRDPANRVVVLFYFSGHSDGVALELGRERLTFAELRRWLATSGADVRVALIDSCKSGALIASKGGTLGPAFQIRLTDELSSKGEALLTSSAADEVSLESSEIGGSYFTHHFVSGLRGAADVSGDGRVTLSEAYQYPYAHTITTTGETIVGPQHPAYDYRFSGRGDLVLTELAKPTASLQLPNGFQRGLVIDIARDQVIAELTSDARPQVAVQPGRYAIRAWRDGKMRAGRLMVAANERRVVRWDELADAESAATRSKGQAELAIQREPPALVISAGLEKGITQPMGMVPSTRVELRMRSGLSVAVMAGTAFHGNTADSHRETPTFLVAGYHVGLQRGALGMWAGIEAGGGLVITTYSGTSMTDYTPAELLAPTAGASYRLTANIALAIEGAVSTVFQNSSTTTLVPALWLGAQLDL